MLQELKDTDLTSERCPRRSKVFTLIASADFASEEEFRFKRKISIKLLAVLTVISTVVSLLLYVSCKCFTFPDALKDLSLRNSS